MSSLSTTNEKSSLEEVKENNNFLDCSDIETDVCSQSSNVLSSPDLSSLPSTSTSSARKSIHVQL